MFEVSIVTDRSVHSADNRHSMLIRTAAVARLAPHESDEPVRLRAAGWSGTGHGRTGTWAAGYGLGHHAYSAGLILSHVS